MQSKMIKVVIENVTYELKFPNVGEFLDIQNLRNMLTNNSYADMIRSGLRDSWFAVDLVDAISLFYTQIPQMREDLNVRNYNDLDVFLAKKIVKAYKTQVKAWYEGLMAELLSDEEFILKPEPKKDGSDEE